MISDAYYFGNVLCVTNIGYFKIIYCIPFIAFSPKTYCNIAIFQYARISLQINRIKKNYLFAIYCNKNSISSMSDLHVFSDYTWISISSIAFQSTSFSVD